MKSRAIKCLGHVFTLACLGFIGYRIYSLGIDPSVLVRPVVLCVMILCCLMLSGLVFVNAVAYKMILEVVCGKSVGTRVVVDVYAASNMGKYLPGNIMHFAGRNILGAKFGFAHGKLLASSFLEVVLKLSVAVVIVLSTSSKYFLQFVGEGHNELRYIIFGIVAILSVVGVHIVFKKFRSCAPGFQVNQRYLSVIALEAFVFVVNIICFICVLVAIIGWEAALGNILVVSGIYLSAWVVGYVTPGAPGGIGVKEAALVLLLSGMVLESDVLLVCVVLRVSSLLGDFLAFMVSRVCAAPALPSESTC